MAAITYKCPNCGGGLLFEPNTQKYRCEYCLSRFDQAELGDVVSEETQAGPGDMVSGTAAQAQENPVSGTAAQAQENSVSGAAAQVPGEDGLGAASLAVVYSCPSCGAEIVTDSTTAATFCYYCHNPVILSGRLEGEFLPDCVVPFSIDRKKAEEIFGEWIKKKRYVPRDFYSPGQVEKMTGVYFPYWLFRCQVEGQINGQGTKLRSWTSGNLRYTERKTYQVERQGQVKIEYVARNALNKANAKLCEGVLPFPKEGLRPFSMGYLSGFAAQKRDRRKEELIPEVYQEVKDFMLIRLQDSDAGYTELRVSQKRADVRDARWEYGLFPVWTLTYKGTKDEKVYYFALNGQTGKVCGELPVDGAKLFLLFISVFLPMLLVLLGAGYFLPF